MGYKYGYCQSPEKAAYGDWQSGLRSKVMVIEVEALLPVGRGAGRDANSQ